ncbi:DUF4386 domain-containing protein [Pseudoduganella namucuonensis]|uniref:DUF4386 domain-containing protein n=1 Tax=Pseudoduganella namucuonensis TaxID=1035707 RepID=A0A1I7IA37_9BURK|nr:DUF4386 domain-containing protein [Pseudoduganella namucuonensis]SFU69797.1 protein of unknown function [Pseudoduganella namucuonensis]
MTAAAAPSPQLYARLCGAAYLGIVALGVCGELAVRGTVVVSGDAAATAANIHSSEALWRAGIAGDLLMHVLDVPVLVLLYLLLRPVGRGLALFATAAQAVQTAVLAVNKLVLLAPLFLLGEAAYLKAFTPEQLQALSYVAIRMHAFGFGIGLVFFGCACLARGYLIFLSGYLPKALGVLMALAGLCYLINSFAMLLAPALARAIFPAILLPPFVAELALSLWLLAKGVDVAGWRRVSERRADVP